MREQLPHSAILCATTPTPYFHEVQHNTSGSPARRRARPEKADGTGATIASVHVARVSQSATVFLAASLKLLALWCVLLRCQATCTWGSLLLLHVATGGSLLWLQAGPIRAYIAGSSEVAKRGLGAQRFGAALNSASSHGPRLRLSSTEQLSGRRRRLHCDWSMDPVRKCSPTRHGSSARGGKSSRRRSSCRTTLCRKTRLCFGPLTKVALGVSL